MTTNGARLLLDTLVAEGVDVCFANPGTSEMHFVAALDDVPAMRGVLALFEGVAAGAADGYGRVTGRPAGVLLHLGPGQGNALANLHNARRAHTPLLSIVGEHARDHIALDAPLTSDIQAVAATFSTAVITCDEVDQIAVDATHAIDAAMGPPSGVATLVLPADVSWGETTRPTPAPASARSSGARPDEQALEGAARSLRSATKAILLVGGRAAAGPALQQAAAIAATVGAELLVETFPAISTRGAGTPTVSRVSYLAEFAAVQLDGCDVLVTLDAAAPVSFFAYPEMNSHLVADGTEVIALAGPADDVLGTMAALADLVGPLVVPPMNPVAVVEDPTGPLSSASLAQAVAATLLEGMVVVDESNTGGIHLAGATAGTPPHEWLALTGGAIGYGLPAAVGAAIGRPDARILCLESDGSAMYTISALWTMAREGLDVTVVVLSNRSYAILNLELARVGATAEGSAAASMLDLTSPELDFVALATGMGVPAQRATTAEELTRALRRAAAASGPQLIEAVLPHGLS
jgi:acetolactate synthase-1/2/3 large subunit